MYPSAARMSSLQRATAFSYRSSKLSVRVISGVQMEAHGYMLGDTSFATLRALHGGNSYDSGLPWQTSCAAKDAPGAARI